MSEPLQFIPGDTVGLIACSDGIALENRGKVEELIAVLNRLGLQVKTASTLFRRDDHFSGSPNERGAALNGFFSDPLIKAVFDISGGDSANQILPHIDFEDARHQAKPFFGVSDLTVVLNSLFQKIGCLSYHYQSMNLVLAHREMQQDLFYKTFFRGADDLFQWTPEWLRGNAMEGIVLGGNIRCFLKLAGTPYFPDLDGKILFLESLGGRANRVCSLLAQLKQMGSLEQCSGLLLGRFTEMEKYGEFPIVRDYLENLTADRGIAIAKTNELGHGSGCRCIKVGGYLSIR